MKDKTTAGVLGILVGGLGIHKFYLGQTGMGIVYVLFLLDVYSRPHRPIEGIKYLTSSQADFDAQYNPQATHPQDSFIRRPTGQPSKVADELKKLHDLKEAGIISEEDFEIQKYRLLS